MFHFGWACSWIKDFVDSELVKKVVLWRLISITITLILLYFITGDIKKATGSTVMLHLILTACNYAFERYWERHNEEG